MITLMADAKKPYLEMPVAPADEEEDDATLAAIEEGRRDADAGRVVPADEVRKLVKQWTTPSSTHKKR
jgi:predicted transcriptional regulator